MQKSKSNYLQTLKLNNSAFLMPFLRNVIKPQFNFYFDEVNSIK